MIVTEEEAQQKYCHVTFGSDTLDKCHASECMAWRKGKSVGRGPNGEPRERDMDGLTRWLPTGYCGLAGSPS